MHFLFISSHFFMMILLIALIYVNTETNILIYDRFGQVLSYQIDVVNCARKCNKMYDYACQYAGKKNKIYPDKNCRSSITYF